MLRSEARLSFLRRRAESPSEVTSFVASQIVRDRAVRTAAVAAEVEFQSADISDAVSRLAAEGNIVIAWGFRY